MSEDDSDLKHLRADIADKGAVPSDYHALVELYAVRSFLMKKDIPSPALDDLFLTMSHKMNKAQLGPNALSTEEILLRGTLVGAVNWLMGQGDTVEKARGEVARITGAEYDKLKRWHQDARQAGMRSKKGEFAMTVPNQANEALVYFSNQYERKHNQMTPLEFLKEFLPKV